MSPDSRDRIYTRMDDRVGDFVFDEAVARVFPDMIQRSVPGYGSLVPLIGLIAAEHFPPGTRCYDLGCSLGAASLAVRAQAGDPRGRRIVGVDNSLAMLQRFAALLRSLSRSPDATPVDLVCADVRSLRVPDASVLILNFTLQFVPPEERSQLLDDLYRQLLPGGLLILSEKLRFTDPDLETCFTRLHHAFKRANGYSELEISRKRTALEKVLRPDTPEALQARLRGAGFSPVQTWFQCLSFASLLAWKS